MKRDILFKDFFIENYTPLYRYVNFKICDPESSREVLKKAFEKIYFKFGRLRDPKIKLLKEIKKHLKKDFAESYFAEGLINILGLQEAARLRFLKKIQSLKKTESDILELKFIASLSNSEIARLYKKTEKRIEEISGRSIKNLKKLESKIE